MRKAVSFATVFVFVLSTWMPAAGQRTLPGTDQKRRIQTPHSRTRESAETTRFGEVTAHTDGRRTVIEWTMSVERSSIGFNVHRTDASGTKIISPEMIPGSAFLFSDEPAFEQDYAFVDHAGSHGASYTIENVAMDGSRIFSNTTVAIEVDSIVDGARGDNERKTDPTQKPLPLLDEMLSLPKDVQTVVEENAAVPDPDTHQWVMAQPGVLIGVNKNGLHRISRAELEAGGFNVNTDHSNWQLYERGVQQAIIVEPAGQYIEFIGKGIDTNESDTRAYFLINGPGAGKRMGLRTTRPNTGTVVSKNYQQTFSLRERTLYTNSIRNGDADNFWGRIINSNATTLSFQLSGVDHESLTATINLRFQGFSSGLHNIQIKLNGQSLPTAVSAGQLAFQVNHQIPTSLLVEGQNTLEFQAAASGDTSLFDQVNISFNRKHLVSNGSLYFYSMNDRRVELDGLSTPNTRLFDIGNDGAPQEVVNLNIVPNGDTYRMSIPAARGALLYAVESGGMPMHKSIVPIGSRILSDPAASAELVIITHKNFLAEAQLWAQYRQVQGSTVDVVLVDDIFEEFNYGVLSADSIKRFLNYAKNNWAGPPQYVLLIGDATYDPRNYNGGAAANYVPARIVNTIFSETASDDFLTDFNNDGLSEIAIGRIPARTNEIIAMFRGKVSRWEANLTNPLSRGALFAFDSPDGQNDFEAMSIRLRDRLPAGTPSTLVGRSMPDSKATLLTAINEGNYIVNYTGHGATGTWGATSFFWNANVTCTSGETHCVNNVNEESMFTMLTCLNGFFHNLTANSLAESLIFAENKGAIAAWASTGLTTPDVQEVMGQRFYTKIGTAEIQRLGDLVNDAKAQIPGGMDVRLSWALLGDPMLKMN